MKRAAVPIAFPEESEFQKRWASACKPNPMHRQIRPARVAAALRQ